MMQDLRYDFRALFKTPIVSAVAIFSLALGIGANTAIYVLFEQSVLRRLPVPEPDRLVNVTSNGPRHGFTSFGIPGGRIRFSATRCTATWPRGRPS
jgi:hypothetical protein